MDNFSPPARLSQLAKDQLTNLKRITRLKQWNVLRVDGRFAIHLPTLTPSGALRRTRHGYRNRLAHLCWRV